MWENAVNVGMMVFLVIVKEFHHVPHNRCIFVRLQIGVNYG